MGVDIRQDQQAPRGLSRQTAIQSLLSQSTLAVLLVTFLLYFFPALVIIEKYSHALTE